MDSGQIGYSEKVRRRPQACLGVAWQTGLLMAHAVLIAIAATDFTLLTEWRTGKFNWNFFRYFQQDGFGGHYTSAYTLWVVLAYIAAYAVGCAAFLSVKRAGFAVVGWAGLILCGLGLASFAFELTHWVSEHQRSFIASFPIATLGLAILACGRVWYRHYTRPGSVA
jgi:hypothetical protein